MQGDAPLISAPRVADASSSKVSRSPLDTVLYWLSSVKSRVASTVPVVLVATNTDRLQAQSESQLQELKALLTESGV